jgi:hypothetical protein
MTFDELMHREKATFEERRACAWFLAMERARATWEALKGSDPDVVSYRRRKPKPAPSLS